MKQPVYLIDTNVALDLLLAQSPYDLDAMQILALVEANIIKLSLSKDAMSTIAYIAEKNKNKQAARQALALLLDFVSLASFDEQLVLKALSLDSFWTQIHS